MSTSVPRRMLCTNRDRQQNCSAHDTLNLFAEESNEASAKSGRDEVFVDVVEMLSFYIKPHQIPLQSKSNIQVHKKKTMQETRFPAKLLVFNLIFHNLRMK